MIRFLIYRPISVCMVYLAILLLAAANFSQIPVSLLPDIPIPELRIIVNEPGLSAEEIEEQILRPIRQRMVQLQKVEDFISTATDEMGTVVIRFQYGVDMDYAFLEVNEKLDQVSGSLPQDIKRPKVIKASISEIPALYLSLSYQKDYQNESYIELSKLAEETIVKRIEQLSSVAMVDPSGLSEQEVEIYPDKAILTQLKLTYQDIERAIEDYLLPLGDIAVKERTARYQLKLNAPLKNIEDLRKVSIRTKERVFRLQDVAEVSLQEREQMGLHLFNGYRAISLAVIKSPAAKTSELKQNISSVIEDLEKTYPEISLSISQDQTSLLAYSINSLKQSFLISAVLALLVVFMFYRNGWLSFILALIIPISLVSTLLFLRILGISLNLLSISGLILGLGLMIDNGIIVLDNIKQVHLEGASIAEACIRGGNEMIRPLLASALTTCSVFLPLILLSGISGALFYDQAIAVSIGLGISYLISITLLPTLYFLLIKKGKTKPQGYTYLLAWYEKGVEMSLRAPILLLFFMMGIVAIGIMVFSQLPSRRLPYLPQKVVECTIGWKELQTIEEQQIRLRSLFLEQEIAEKIQYYSAFVGKQDFLLKVDQIKNSQTARLHIAAKTSADIPLLQQEIRNHFKDDAGKVQISFSAPETIFEKLFPGASSTFSIGLVPISRADINTYTDAYSRFATFLRSQDSSLSISELPVGKAIVLTPQYAKLSAYDIQVRDLYQAIRRLTGGIAVSSIQNSSYALPIQLGGGVQNLTSVLNEHSILSGQGALIPIQELVTLQDGSSLKQIHANLEGPYLPLSLTAKTTLPPLELITEFEQQHPAIRIARKDQFLKNQQLIQEVFVVMLVAILLLYFIMAAQFESLLQPLIILLEIPISLSGSLLMLYLFDNSLNIMAMIGMVVCCGIMINDSIIKIDTINRLRRQGLRTKAAIKKGGIKRLNPILMTSLTTVVAVVPFLFSSQIGSVLQTPLALSLIGGMLVGTLASLYFIPLIYSLLYKD